MHVARDVLFDNVAFAVLSATHLGAGYLDVILVVDPSTTRQEIGRSFPVVHCDIATENEPISSLNSHLPFARNHVCKFAQPFLLIHSRLDGRVQMSHDLFHFYHRTENSANCALVNDAALSLTIISGSP